MGLEVDVVGGSVEAEGEVVGFAVGLSVDSVGEAVGAVGVSVGLSVGLTDGATLGLSVGVVGLAVGLSVGLTEGAVLGEAVGVVGLKLGLTVEGATVVPCKMRRRGVAEFICQHATKIIEGCYALPVKLRWIERHGRLSRQSTARHDFCCHRNRKTVHMAD